MNKAVILGNHTQGLGIVRSLKDCPIEVNMVNDKHIALARFSRYLDRYHRLPGRTFSRLDEPQAAAELIGVLNRIADGASSVAVFCTDEDLGVFIHANRERLDDAFQLPENDIELITDKYRFACLLGSLQLSSPKTFLASEFQEKDECAVDHGYLLKGRQGMHFRQMTKRKAIQVKSSIEVQHMTEKLDFPLDQMIVQEILPLDQKVLSVCGFAVGGKLLEEFQYAKIRQRPADYGTGTFLKSMHDPTLSKVAEKLISGLAYTGIFEIEVIPEEGTYKVIEMNPRTWKSISFATDCGVNLCCSYCSYLFTKQAPEKTQRKYLTGHSWSHLTQDIVAMTSSGSFTRKASKAHFCVCDPRDPLPFVMELLLMPLILLKV